MLTQIITGFGIGLLGSFHCIGMCGPLAVSLPLNSQSKFHRFLSIAAYNTGRAATYFILGLIFGAIGSSFFLVGYQQALSIALGLVILLILFFGNKMSARIPVVNKFHQGVKKLLTRLLLKEKKLHSYFVIGMVNGLLPCGLVYLAIASAAATGSALGGGLLMLFFGLGTIPLMFLLMIAGNYFSAALRYKIRKLVPVFVGVMACVLILRGLNLGIPYISPTLAKQQTMEVINCHEEGTNTNILKR